MAVAAPVYRNRSQATTRRLTPTNITAVAPSVERLLPNGDLYMGSFSGNVPHGSGKYLWTDGCMYEGEWRRGKASGKGKYSWPSGATYVGKFKSGRMEGFGTFIGSDGDNYRGNWSADRKHGYGRKLYANGDFYNGFWKKNLQDGQGKYVWSNGNKYVGGWKNGVISGRGVLILVNGNCCDAQWENGVAKGHRVFSCLPTWDVIRDFALQDDRLVLDHISSDDEEDGGCETEEALTSHLIRTFASRLVLDHISSDDEEYERGCETEEAVVKEICLETLKEETGVRIGETEVSSESDSFHTANDDDFSCTTTETMPNICPNGRFKRNITGWKKDRFLGRGSFGSVYEGISGDGFVFALKEVSLLDQGSPARQCIFQLEQEIDLLSRFEHENIVQYYGSDKDESNLYIFLELAAKGSLLNLYQRYNLEDSQVSSYTGQILHGLKYLHDRDVVHRDIKCANILVDANESVKLADFGLAKVTKLNDVNSFKGTASWMAPEVVNQKNQGYGLPADIWSLGCTVLEMLTRKIPYSPLEWFQALYKIGQGELPPVPDSLSKDARDFILQCLQVNPNNRPTAAQLLGHSFVRRSLSTSLGSASPYHGRRN